MKVDISDETYMQIKKYLDSHKHYKKVLTLEDMINSILNIGWYAYRNDGINGSIHPKPGGDFGIHC
jgi:hypothetical protein